LKKIGSKDMTIFNIITIIM